MNKSIILIILISIGCFSQNLKAQNNNVIDSLKQDIAQTQVDTLKILNLLKIGDQFEYVIPDSALYYYKQALELSEQNKQEKFIAKCCNYIGIVYLNQGLYEKAISNFQKSVEINKKNGDKIAIAKCYTNIGSIHFSQGEYIKAIKFYKKSLRIKEELGNKSAMATTFMGIGSVYQKQGLYDKSIEFLLKALKINEDINNQRGISSCYSNIGIVYQNQKMFDTAIEYYQKALKIVELTNDKSAISNCLSNIGISYLNKQSYKKAETFFFDALKISEEIGDIASLSAYNINIGQVYLEQGNYEKAKIYYQKSIELKKTINDKNGLAIAYAGIARLNLEIANDSSFSQVKKNSCILNAIEHGNMAFEISSQIEATPVQNNAAHILMKAYTVNKQYKKAIEFSEIYISTKDSMFSIEKTKAVSEVSYKFEEEKTQLIIERMERQKLLDEKTIEAEQIKNRKQLLITFLTLFGFIIVLVFFLIIFRMFRQKRKANIRLEQQNDEISQQKEEISSQRDKVQKQKEIIEEVHHEISQSIDYATRLQQSVLPEEKLLTKYLSDHFVFFKPKDKVSGDFYWWTHIEGHTVITVADCTGHGVPGAFMSMLGVSFLREIVEKEHVIHTGKILSKLREEIIKALRQKGETGEQKDGMDMAIISISHETNICQYSGANNPLYLIKNKKLGVKNEGNASSCVLAMMNNKHQLFEVKPNKMPIAIYEKMDNFTTHEIQLEKGDQLYMFSDGYADQFGGTKGKKYKYKPFKQLFLDNANRPMMVQREILDKTFCEWKRNMEQIDDVAVIGIKIHKNQ